MSICKIECVYNIQVCTSCYLLRRERNSTNPHPKFIPSTLFAVRILLMTMTMAILIIAAAADDDDDNDDDDDDDYVKTVATACETNDADFVNGIGRRGRRESIKKYEVKHEERIHTLEKMVAIAHDCKIHS